MATTTSMQAVLDALRDGPATLDELKDRTGIRRRSTLDKALTELNHARVITPIPAEEGEEPRWARVAADETATTDENPASQGAPEGDEAAEGEQATEGKHAAAEAAEDTGEHTPKDVAQDVGQDVAEKPGTPESTDEGRTGEGRAEASGDESGEPAGDAADPGATPEESRTKTCAGCQEQMPTICPCCWRTTLTYCGKCRRTMPARRPGAPQEPQILSNGLPKLRPGQLEVLVLDVLRSNPLPTYKGVTGWTAGRVAVHLPGRSTGAIIGILDKLAGNGTLHLLGEKPMRYQLTEALAEQGPTNDPGTETNAETATEPVAEQPDGPDAQPEAPIPSDQRSVE